MSRSERRANYIALACSLGMSRADAAELWDLIGFQARLIVLGHTSGHGANVVVSRAVRERVPGPVCVRLVTPGRAAA